ncbi:uncharacterized protein LOC131633025 [Vicia villosa]|uniref:uncharacterized protein LOC131633025 n=1 Tax=Vicia villosa TaxID=3911 RepID=UPI00273B88C0|nr:uncharacterized protein LOC131633025 [Vicia villosa]
MATQKLSEYELKRLENIRRNTEMISALNIHSKASQLFKRPRAVTKLKSEKKPKTETPNASRRSLRIRGVTPDPSNSLPSKTKPRKYTLGAYKGTHSDCSFIETLKQQSNGTAKSKNKAECSFELESMSLDPENISKVVPERVTQMRFFPSNDINMIVAGDTNGSIGFWNVGQSEVFLYRPHQTLIIGIVVQSHCLSKIYTSCKDGFVKMMDAEKEIFDMVYQSSDKAGIYALAQPKNEANCLYLAEGSGGLTVWDSRMGKCSSSSCLALHRRRINTIDFNPENPHIAVTSSADGIACTWDFRFMGGLREDSNLPAIRRFTHERGLQSAYFSPSGCSLAITSTNNTVVIYSGVNLKDAAFVNHESSRKLSIFRAIWGWDDSYLFTGSTKGGIAVVSTAQKATVMTLESPLISAIPHKFDAHSYEVGMLAGGSSGGQVYVWTSR